MNPQTLLSNPFEEIDRYYTISLSGNISPDSDYNLDLSQQFHSTFLSGDLLSQIPDFASFSCYADLKKQNGKLVKMTYMVQNIDDPEIFAHCLVKKENPANFFNVKYRENFGQEVSSFDLENDCLLSERLSTYCIPITGDNTHKIPNKSNIESEPHHQEKQENINFQDLEINVQENIGNFFETFQKKGIFNSNNPKSFPAVVKVYDSNMQSIKLNETYEIVGILAYNSSPDEPIEPNENFDHFNNQYPSHLIPRIHCLALKKMRENEMEDQILSQISKKYPISPFKVQEIQKQLLNIFNHITNDELSSFYILFGILNNFPQKKAEYLENIRKLVVNVYKTSKIQFSLANSQNIAFPQLLSRIFEKICPKSLYFPVDIESLEKSLYIPTKNYDTNRLEIGKLQMTPSTTICVDETKMTEGKLTEKGLKNLQFLNDFLENQTVSFDFSYHQTKITCDCNVIVCSEGKSFLKTNINIPLETQCPNQIQALNPQVSEILDINPTADIELLLDSFRYFILKAQQNLRSMKINEEVSKKIEEDYVNSRKATPSIDVESLQRWIILGKLLSACDDCLEMSFQSYLRAKDLESLRMKRLS